MKKGFLSFGMMILLGLSVSLFAGDGHDHGVPGAVAAPKGGEIKPAHGSYFELLKVGNVLKIYPYDDKLKPLTLTNVTDLTMTTKVPRGAEEKLSFKTNADHYEASYEPKKTHRYELSVKFKIKGEVDSVTFNVEKN
jgi:hypothetical protein